MGAEIKKDSELLVELSPETREGLLKIKGDLLAKAGLSDFNEDLVRVNGA